MINLMPIDNMRFHRRILILVIAWGVTLILMVLFFVQWRHRLYVDLSRYQAKPIARRVILPVPLVQLVKWRQDVQQRHHRVESIWSLMRKLPRHAQLEHVTCQSTCEWVLRSTHIKYLRQLSAISLIDEQEGGWYRAHISQSW